MNIRELFEKHEGEHRHFERVVNKLSQRPDIHAFILLDRICPDPDRDIISSAEHDKIWLEPDLDDVNTEASEENVIELIRCGVLLDTKFEALYMFV